MASALKASPMLVARRIEAISGIRPVTLLIASGIGLVIAILAVTGTAANHLRGQALAAAEGDLARVDSVVATATDRSLLAVDGRLAEVTDQFGAAASGGVASFREAAPLGPPLTGASSMETPMSARSAEIWRTSAGEFVEQSI